MRSQRLLTKLLLIMVAVALAAPARAADNLKEPDARVATPPERAYSAFSDDRHRQFDFWIGRWDVNLRMQQDDLTFKDSIRAAAHIYSILDGKAILELWDSEPIKGYSLRYYDPAEESWVLWLNWPSNNRSGISSLEGGFRHGRGDFTSTFTNARGEQITQRYSFNDITPFSLRWDDLHSKDGGKTWGKNWIMEFNRVAVDPDWPVDPDNVPTFADGSRCDDGPFRPYEAVVGNWEGDGAALEAFRILDGCAVMAFLDTGDHEEFLFLTWLTGAQKWETGVLDDRRDTGLRRYTGAETWTELTDSGEQRLSWSVDGGRLTYIRGETAVEMKPSR